MDFNAMLLQTLVAFPATLGFGSMYNLHGKKLVLAALGGMVGLAIYLALYQLTRVELLGYFITAILTTLYSQQMARRLRCPASMFMLMSIVPMLPGGYLYYSMYYAVQGDMDLFWSYGGLTLGTAGVLAAGIVVGSYIFGFFMWLRSLSNKRNGDLQ